MRLDRTRIAIRERGLLDIFDMSLRVAAAFAGPLALCAAAVVLPLMLLNGCLVGWLPQAGDGIESRARYLWAMSTLILIQMPLLSLFMTPFLGAAMFLEDVGMRDLCTTVRNSLGALVVSPLLVRGIALSVVMAAGIPRGDGVSGAEVGLVLLAIYASGMRALRPFICEIVLLERNPWRSDDPRAITIGRRNTALHSSHAGDLVFRWMGSVLLAGLMVLSLLATFWFAWGMLLFDWNWGPAMLHLFYPLTLWIVAAYFTIVRFLSYLDLRIRREGWEVELMMRAAAAQLAGTVT